MRPELLIVGSKKLRQACIMRLLETWADAMRLTVKAVVPDGQGDTCCVRGNCQLIIIGMGGASIEEAQHQALIKSLRDLMARAPLVIISDREDPQEVCAAFQAGAIGFIPTSIEPAIAFQALSFIRSGGSFFPPSVLSACLGEVTGNAPVNDSDLTIKQEEVFGLLRQGFSNKIIARRLGMSEATVKVHARRLMHKFGVTNRTQLALAAMNQSSLPPVDNSNAQSNADKASEASPHPASSRARE